MLGGRGEWEIGSNDAGVLATLDVGRETLDRVSFATLTVGVSEDDNHFSAVDLRVVWLH